MKKKAKKRGKNKTKNQTKDAENRARENRKAMRAEKVQYQTAYAVHITCKLLIIPWPMLKHCARCRFCDAPNISVYSVKFLKNWVLSFGVLPT